MNKFSVLAIISARNEIDILPQVVRHLRRQGVDVYLMDDWSTDGTWEALPGWDLAGFERFPANAPSKTFDLAAQLRRKEEIAMQSDVTWCINQDADEVRRSSRPGETLLEALRRFDADGFTAANHRLLNYASRDGWAHGMDPETFFTELEDQGRVLPRWGLHHIKAWKNLHIRVGLDSLGGHVIEFPGKRVAPELLLLKHYPLRGSELSEAKLKDRRARWNAEERRRGWHVQYDPVRPGVSLIVPTKYQDIFEQMAASIERLGQGITERIAVIDGAWAPRNRGWKALRGAQPFRFSRNSNIGLRAADSHNDVLLMNDDVSLLQEATVSRLQDCAMRVPLAGVVSPRFIGGVGNALQQAGRPMSGPLVSSERLCFVTVYIPRSTINRVGLLDERFVGYGGDDVDYCLRVQKAGLRLIVEPNVIMRHGFGPHSYSSSFLRCMSHEQRDAEMAFSARQMKGKWA